MRLNQETVVRDCGHTEQTWDTAVTRKGRRVLIAHYVTDCSPDCVSWGGVVVDECSCGCGWVRRK